MTSLSIILHKVGLIGLYEFACAGFLPGLIAGITIECRQAFGNIPVSQTWFIKDNSNLVADLGSFCINSYGILSSPGALFAFAVRIARLSSFRLKFSFNVFTWGSVG